MKFKRFIIAAASVLCLLTSCTVNDVNSTNEGTNSNFSSKLNISQADIIANVTENAKYLNPDILYNVDTLEDTDTVTTIITLSENGLMDAYSKNTLGYSTIGEYSNSSAGTFNVSQMQNQQNKLIKYLRDNDLIEQVKYSYTTLFNGFAVETTYAKYKEIYKMGIASNVTLCEVYSEPQSEVVKANVVENVVDVYETGIFNSSAAAELGYTGSNTAVAILDSGFDVHHSVFKTPNADPMISKTDVGTVLTDLTAYSFQDGLKVEDVYLNSKIPYAYDYADKDEDVSPYDSDHGTHVAGIIGGKDDVVTGVAVDTQLVLMKVFGDINNGALQEDIMAALEDSVLLGVDAINLSLGQACGFTTCDDEKEGFIAEVYDKIRDAGISLIVAASNDYNSAYGGAESNTSKASNPDNASVGSPSTYLSALSVASISGVKSKYITTEDGYTFFFNEANNMSSEAYDFYEMLSEELGATEGLDFEIDYVTVPGFGLRANYSAIDVRGKIALVKRGDISFEEKAKYATEAGAIGCIVYNNLGGDIYMSAGNDLEIAFCSISKDDGEYLAAKSTGTLIFNTSNLAGPFMSDFSSWGPSPDLSLKPEITAHGGTILSSVPGGGYDEISGTSMASPNLCGVALLVRQYLKEMYPDITPVNLTTMSNQLMMSTSTIILDKYGNPYSPRKVGSGLANLMNALTTKAYITVDGSDKTKIELKDDPKEKGVYTLEFNIVNISNESVEYNLSNYTMTESLSTSNTEYIAEKAYMLNPSTSIKVDGVNNSGKIVVPANETVKVSYTLTLSEAEKKYIRQSFENGMYVEGFAVLDPVSDKECELSIPFLAFFGDWTEAPLFDKTYYEVESEAYNNSIDDEDKLKADYYATTPLGSYYYSYIIPLGSYVYTIDETKYDKIPASEEHAAMAYSLETINGITCVYAGLLRNAKTVITTITNTETGDVVYYRENKDQIKAHYSGGQVPSYDILEITAYGLGLENNVNYTLTMSAELDYGDGGAENNLNNSFSFTFYVDNDKPLITDTNFYAKYDKTLKENRYYVDVYVYDNHYAQSIRPFVVMDGELSSLVDNPIPIYCDDKNSVAKVTVELTDYMDYLQYSTGTDGLEFSNGFGFMIDDYALNANYYYVSLPGTDATELWFYDEAQDRNIDTLYVSVGQELDLAPMVRTNDPTFDSSALGQAEYMSKLTWISSNENVVRVKNGKLEGVGAGTTYITARTLNNHGNNYEKSIKIVVRDNPSLSSLDSEVSLVSDDVNFSNKVKFEGIEFTYFETLKAFEGGPEESEIGEVGDTNFVTAKPVISFYPSEQVKLNYEISPWNLDPSRYELIWASTKPEVASVDDKGVVTGLKEGNTTITLRIKVDGKLSNMMAKINVVVKSEFVIENRSLVAYKGLGGNVVIPDDEGIMMISSFAFSLYTIDYTIKIEESDYDAAKTPSKNDTITSVTIPSTVTEVGKYAFYNCIALEEVIFEVDPKKGDSCQIIRDRAFEGCESLSKINSENLLVIGERAFKGCTSLETFDFSGIYAIGRRAFEDCTALNNIDLTTLRNAGAEVFLNCTSLQTVKTGEFTKYSDGMFKNSALTAITFYSDRIPNNCFFNCDSLTNVEIMNDIIYVGSNAFGNCDSLDVVTIHGACDFIYEKAFANSSVTKVTLPNSSVKLEAFIFEGCTKLNTLVFQENTYLSEILQGSFNNCDELAEFIVVDSKYYGVSDNYLLMLDDNSIVLVPHNINLTEMVLEDATIHESAFSGISTINKLTLNNCIVEKYAFAYCDNLTELTINSTISEGAFYNCSKLTSLKFNNGMQSVPAYAFANTGLTSLDLVVDSIEEGAFKGSKLQNINIDADYIGASAFEDCIELTSIKIDANEIASMAFNNCSAISEFVVNSVKKIGASAFDGCTGLKDLDLSTVTEIGSYAFANCPNLTSIDLSSVKSIGAYAFTTTNEKATIANKLASLTLPQVETIGSYAFSKCTSLTNVDLGQEVQKIESFAFANCSSLQSVNSECEIAVISEGAFAWDSELESVNISGIERVESGAFNQCFKLANIDLSNATYIGIEAFYYNLGLVSIDLTSAVTIEPLAFYMCSNLATITAPALESIGEQSFSKIAIDSFVIPSTIKHIAPTAFLDNKNQVSFETESVDGLTKTTIINEYAQIHEGVLYITSENGKYVLQAYPTGKTEESYTVIDNTIRIALYAAAYNPSIKEVTFPDTLKLIGNFAFYKCENLATVEFRSTVAPTLEGTVYDTNTTYDPSSEIYQFINKYLNLNGAGILYYAQFKEMIGLTKKLNIVLPSNDNLEGYDSVFYNLYFNLDNATISEFVGKDKYTIDFLNKIKLVPTDNISLSDEDIIVNARTAYNTLKQDLTDFGYTSDDVNDMLTILSDAEAAFKVLKDEKIKSKYGDLITDVAELGSSFDYSKVSEYKRLMDLIERLDKDDKKYMESYLSNYENFKEEYNQYFLELSEDIQIATSVSTLPTTTVTVQNMSLKKSATILTSLFSAIGSFGLLFTKKSWFLGLF